jgi:hypothetical protein
MSKLALERFVLCRPEGGLNDMLCQIEATYAYAVKSERSVIVDTNYQGSRAFKDSFSNYFSSLDSRLILDTDILQDRFDICTVFPTYITGRLKSYTTVWSSEISNWADSETNSSLTYDFDRLYDEQILLHHACGGGQISLNALSKLELQDDLIYSLAQRINAIGQPYSAIHIRNTDYKSDYKPALHNLKRFIKSPIFIATDDRKCREYCVDLFGEGKVKFFSNLPEEGGIPLHGDILHDSIFQRNKEAILDLMTLALSNDYFKISLIANKHHTTYSGFSILAENLKNSPVTIRKMLGKSRLANTIRGKVGLS